MRLLPGAADGGAPLNAAGIPAVVVTNQSGIARGLLTEADYRPPLAGWTSCSQASGARLDGHYHCPHLPEISGPCDCRKPGALLYGGPPRELGLDLAASWWMGDRLRDLEAADRLRRRGRAAAHRRRAATAAARADCRGVAPHLISAVGILASAESPERSDGATPFRTAPALETSAR